MTSLKTALALSLWLLSSTQLMAASDHAKEARWAEQVVADLFDGEAITLNDGQSEFLGLYTQADQPLAASVIVLHGIGVHPDWPQVIQPLRVELAALGWSTLSIQLPVLENGAAQSAYTPLLPLAADRIEAARAYLKQQGAQNIVLVAHSMGAKMANYYLSNRSDHSGAQNGVAAYVAIGMGSDDEQSLQDIKIPWFDLFGEDDLAEVLAGAPARKAALGLDVKYEQLKVGGADHFFTGKEQELVGAVSTWLREQFNIPQQ